MARIVIMMFPEPGHLLPTLRLATRLNQDGHSVTYVTLPNYEAALRRLGFDVVPGFRDSPNDDTGRGVEALPLWSTAQSGVALWRRLSTRVGLNGASIRQVIRATAPETLVPGLVAARPDLLLCDAKIAAACGDLLEQAMGGVPIVAMRTELPIGDLVPYPELVLCPVELELPALRTSVVGRHYCEPSVFVDRHGDGGCDGLMNAGECVVFCSLGSQGETYEAGATVLTRVVEAFSGRRGYRLLLAAGALAGELRIPADASNVEVRRTLNQPAVLARTSLAILHGGLGGVKEAILAGVPMMIIPFVFDQRPNAERVVAHNLGAMVLPGDTDPTLLRLTADDVMSSGRIATAMAAMRQVFREAEAREIAYELTTKYLERTEVQ